MSLTLQPGALPLGVNLGEGGAVVTNYGAGTVSYSDTEAPFVAEGTIAPAGVVTLYGTQYFVAATGSTLDVRLILPGTAAATSVSVTTLTARLDTDALDTFRAALTRRDQQPVVMVACGSSTTSGSDASTPEKRYVNRLVRMIQAQYPLESGTHPDLIAIGGSSGATCGLLGVNAGVAGTTSANYLTPTTIAQAGAFGPSLVTHMIAGNDFNTAVPVATFKANVVGQIAALRVVIAGPCVHLLIHTYRRFDITEAGRPAWAAYGVALREIAESADDLAFIDLSFAYSRVGVPSTDPLGLVEPDSVHQNDFGHAFMADALCKAMGFSGATVASKRTFSDDFTRADGVPGNGWFASNFAIASNQVTAGAGVDATLSRAHAADGYVQGRFKAGIAQSTGVHFRRAADDSLIRFMVRASGSVFTYTLGTFGPGSSNFVVIGSSAIVPAIGDLLRVEFSGTTVRCYVNGALIISATTSWNLTETGVGFRSFPSTTIATSWDDFAMGTL